MDNNYDVPSSNPSAINLDSTIHESDVDGMTINVGPLAAGKTAEGTALNQKISCWLTEGLIMQIALLEVQIGEVRVGVMAGIEMNEFRVSHRFFIAFVENVAVIESEDCDAAQATGDETSLDNL